MGKFKRIQVQDIKTAQKSLDDLPDKNLGKTREEAAEMLNASIRKALEKGYTIREVSEIIARDNVSIPIPTIRAKVLPPKEPAPKKETKPKPATTSKAAKPTEAITQEIKKEPETPDYYTADRPDSEL